MKYNLINIYSVFIHVLIVQLWKSNLLQLIIFIQM